MGLFGPSKRDVLEEGRQAMATVRGVSNTGTVVNGRPRIELTLEVAPMGQPTFITTPCHWVRFIVCCDRAG